MTSNTQMKVLKQIVKNTNICISVDEVRFLSFFLTKYLFTKIFETD